MVTQALQLLLLLVVGIQGAPINDPCSNLDDQKTEAYLDKYGYLPKKSNGQSPEQRLMIAVRRFQATNKLKVTGERNDETCNLMNTPRCQLDDLNIIQEETGRRKKRYVTQGSKWPTTDLTWSMINYTPDLSTNEVDSIIARAFKQWEDASQLSFEKVVDPGDIRNLFASGAHGDSSAFDGPGGVLAHAYFPEQGAISGDAHFDDGEAWVTYPSGSGVHLEVVAIHEYGHSLGLSHSNDQSAIMYAYYGPSVTPEIKWDDCKGIQAIYDASSQCAAQPCENNGCCMTDGDTYSCICASGYTGENCATNIDDCNPNPCQNGGTCVDGINEFTCTCVRKYRGTTCESGGKGGGNGGGGGGGGKGKGKGRRRK